MPTAADIAAGRKANALPSAKRNPFDDVERDANPFDAFDGDAGKRTAADYGGMTVRAVGRGVAGLRDTLDSAVNPLSQPLRMLDQAAALGDLVTGKGSMADFAHAGQGQGDASRQMIDSAADKARLPRPSTSGEQLYSAAVEGGVQGLAGGPAGEGRAIIGNLVRDIVSGGAGGGTTEAARQAGAPAPVQFLAGLVAGGGTAAGIDNAAVAAGAARSAVPAAVRDAASPFVAAVSKDASERQAAGVLAGRASDPEAARIALEAPAEIVPGSKPTTFQQTGDMGLGALEREVQTRSPTQFAERRADQNTARTSALSEIQSGADPNDVAKALKAQFDELDTATQEHVDAVRADAQAKAQAVGGAGNVEDYGASVRAALNDAENAARARERGLWRAVDPDGDLTGNVSPTASAAKEITGKISKTAKPMAGEEAAIFDVASSLPAISPVSHLIDLRSRVSTEMRNELMANGNSPSYARLTQLRGAIQDNLANTISLKVAQDDAAVARGTMPVDDALATHLKNWTDEFYSHRTAARTGDQGGDRGIAGRRSSGVSGVRGAEGQAGRSSDGTSSNPGLSGDAPSFDAAAAGRLEAATEATKARARTFGSQPVSSAVARAGTADQFKLPDGRVASRFFHPGPSGFGDMQALFSAAGEATARPVIEDYAAHSLRRAAAREDGVLDPAKYARWKAAHADALRALPADARAKFETAAKAGDALTEASAARNAQLKDAQAGAIGKIMGLSSSEDVTRTVGQILTGRTAAADMKELVRATAGNPMARQGLRQAVADFITGKLIGNTEAGTSGTAQIKADAYQTFFRQNRGALNLVFKPAEVEMMDAVARDIQRAKRSENAVRMPGNSNTAQDVLGATKGRPLPGGKTILDALGAGVGSLGGPFGAIGGFLSAHLLQNLRAAGIARVDELVTTAMLHPEIARELLRKAPPTPHPAATRKLTFELHRLAGVGAAAAGSQGDNGQSRAAAVKAVE
ncbi:hypothetical protein ASD89_24060 [Caulobacter sp. Root656]|nr:hypothetical protein ASD89_24060 [Caulobacter sp. Root656]